MRIPAPKPGFYRMPMEQYRAIDAVNFSWLKRGLPGVGYMIAERDSTYDSESMLIGRAVHCLLLEPMEYANRFTTAPKIDRRTKAGKAEWAEYVEAAKGKEVLTEDEACEAGAISAAVERNTRAASMLRAKGERELTCIWKDEPTGLMLKCRMDLVVPGTMGVLTDLKTTDRAYEEAFAKSIVNYSYDVQSAMYADGYRANTGRKLEHAIIAADQHAAFVYTMGDASVNVGRIKYRRVLHEYARVLSGEQPAWDDSVRVIELPSWELKKYGSEGGFI